MSICHNRATINERPFLICIYIPAPKNRTWRDCVWFPVISRKRKRAFFRSFGKSARYEQVTLTTYPIPNHIARNAAIIQSAKIAVCPPSRDCGVKRVRVFIPPPPPANLDILPPANLGQSNRTPDPYSHRTTGCRKYGGSLFRQYFSCSSVFPGDSHNTGQCADHREIVS